MGLIQVVKSGAISEWYQKAAEKGFRPALVSLRRVKPQVGDFIFIPEQSNDVRLLHIRAIGGDQKACLKLKEWYLEKEQYEESDYWLMQAVRRKNSNDLYTDYHGAKALFSTGTEEGQRRGIEIMRDLARKGYALF